MFKSIIYRLYAVYLAVNVRKVKIGRSVVVSFDSLLHSNVTLLDYVRVFQSKINSYSYVSPFSIVIKAEIGKYTSIGPGCKIGLGVHPLDFVSTSPYLYNDNLFKKKNDSDFEEVVIGSDVWIGANVLIMGGVKVGHGAVIGAGSVVTKDVPPYSVVVGVPAKIIKYRFTPDIIDLLIETEWWNKPHHLIMQQKHNASNVNAFIEGVNH
jgi:acetyltransferase-like isoleucine patch superfamily enzyme